MLCSNCGTKNAVGSRFCNQCGKRLGQPCPKCTARRLVGDLFEYRDLGAVEVKGMNRASDGIPAMAEGLELCRTSGVRLLESELHRLKGELLLRTGNREAAAESFHDAIELARHQGARSWELRSTLSLTRLLMKQGRRDEARTMLTEIYNWFTEGFETADLKDGKALLDDLSA